MPKFSVRYGYEFEPEPDQEFDGNRANETLRTSLWGALSLSMWNLWQPSGAHRGYTPESERINSVLTRMWQSLLKLDVETLPMFKGDPSRRDAFDILKDYFFACDWYKVCDFIEFLVQDTDTLLDNHAIQWINQIFKHENTVCRIVGNKIIEAADMNGIAMIEDGSSTQGS